MGKMMRSSSMPIEPSEAALLRKITARHFPGSRPYTPKSEAHGTVDLILELGKFVSLLACILCLCALFHTIFFLQAEQANERLEASLKMFAVAAAVCWASGMIFSEEERRLGAPRPNVAATLPMKAFWWVTVAILIFYLISWYLEQYFLPLRSQPLW